MAGTLDSRYLSPGNEVFAGFRLLERISKGVTGEVWRACRHDGAAVVLKCLETRRLAISPRLRSMGLVLPIRHPHLVMAFGPWERNGWMAIGMELAEGSLLGQFEAARRGGRPGLDPGELIDQIGQAATGVDFLNEPRHSWPDQATASLIHRDIKPANLFLVDSTVKVADFGLVYRFVPGLGGDPRPVERSFECPVNAYSAPELARGEVSTRSDQYSLAASYYFLRTGAVPVPPTDHSGAPDLTSIPEPERPALARALELDPARRWPTCADFVAALRAAIPQVVSIPGSQATPSPMVAPVVRVDQAPEDDLLGAALEEIYVPLLLTQAAAPILRSAPPAPIPPVQFAAVVPTPRVIETARPIVPPPSLSKAPESARPVPAEPVVRATAPAVAPAGRPRWRLLLPIAGLAAGILALVIGSGLRGPTSRIGRDGGDPAVRVAASDSPTPPSTSALVVPDEPGTAAVEPPLIDPPVDAALVATNLVIVASETPFGPARDLAAERYIRSAVEARALASRPPSPPALRIGRPAPPPASWTAHTGTIEPLAPPRGLVLIDTPEPAVTGAEVAGVLRSWAGATLGRLGSRARSLQATGRSWARALSHLASTSAPSQVIKPTVVPPGPRAATILVLMPTDKAELAVRGDVGRGNPDEWYGPTRVIHTPPITLGQDYLVGAFWVGEGGRLSQRSQPLRVEPGRRYEVDLRNDQTTASERPLPPDP